MPTATASRNAVLRLALPEKILDAYQAEADQYDVPVDDLIAHRLTTCVDHTAQKPLYFDDTDRQAVEKLLGRNFRSAKEVVALIRNLVSVKLAGIDVNLSPTLLVRLQTRCFKPPFDQWVAQLVAEQLEQFCGMR